MTRDGTGPESSAADPLEEAEAALQLSVVAGLPTAEELAAVTAVLHAAVREQGGRDEPLAVPDGRHWQRAAGMLRAPIAPGPGAWRTF